MRKITLLWVVLMAAIIVSCGEDGPKPPEAGKLTTYTDESVDFSMGYPENWEDNKAIGKQFQAFSMPEGKSRFSTFDTQGLPVARVSVTFLILDSNQTLQTAIDTSKIFSPEYYNAPVDVKVGGTTGKKLAYSFPLSDGQFDGELIVASQDGLLAHIIKFEAFGGSMEQYRATFDEILKSMKLGTKPERTVITGEAEELPPPSDKMKTEKGEGYSIQIPDNFQATQKGNRTIYAGERRGDSYVSVTVSKTASSNLKGTAERNAKAVGAKTTTKMTIGGKEAYLVSYDATPQIHRDMYYVINNGKLYQIVVDYFKEAEDMYKNVLTKSAKSLKF